MEIQKDQQGKWLRPQYGSYLTQASATEDVDKVLVQQVYVPLTESNDEWVEITAEEAERIRKAKEAAKGNVEYPEEEVNQALGLLTMTINTMNLTDEQAVSVKSLFPKWETFIGGSLEKGVRVSYNNKLYKVIQAVPSVQEGQEPDKVPANYSLISEHKGTKEDPIPYERWMLIEKNKYYTQNGKLYIGILDAPNGYDADLETLSTLVKLVEE